MDAPTSELPDEIFASIFEQLVKCPWLSSPRISCVGSLACRRAGRRPALGQHPIYRDHGEYTFKFNRKGSRVSFQIPAVAVERVDPSERITKYGPNLHPINYTTQGTLQSVAH